MPENECEPGAHDEQPEVPDSSSPDVAANPPPRALPGWVIGGPDDLPTGQPSAPGKNRSQDTGKEHLAKRSMNAMLIKKPAGTKPQVHDARR